MSEPAVTTTTEYGYLVEYADGFRCAVSPFPAATIEEAAEYVFGYISPSYPPGSRYVLVARQVTTTAWTDQPQKEQS